MKYSITTKLMALGKAPNIYIDYLSRQTTCEMKVYIQQWFHDEQGAKFKLYKKAI